MVQGTVDYFGRFTDINIGWPGRVHDARVWRNSSISAKLRDGTFVEPAWTEVIGGQEFSEFYVLGDAAYPGTPHLVKGFTGTPLSREQDHFNYKLSGARMTVERAFGRLKGRWKILDRSIQLKSLERSLDYIGACCILHNLCEQQGQYYKDTWNDNVAAEAKRQQKRDLMDPSEYANEDGGPVVEVALRDALLRQMPVASNWRRRDYRL